MYDPNAKRIHMPGRSNSFAHEWGHALDHFLRNTLTPNAEKALLTQVARSEGLNPLDSIQAAYVNLIHRMFFDEADLALRMMDLEVTAQKVDANGNPTKAALAATAQLEQLAAGSTRLRIKPSSYRADSATYSPSQAGYYASVHEMFARAFEAYVGFKMEQAGAKSNAFVTKGDAAYLSDADARLAKTFPKAQERFQIFDAFEDVFHHLRNTALLGTDPAAKMPTDADIMDPAHWAKMGLAADLAEDRSFVAGLKQEAQAVKNTVKKILSPLATLKSSTTYLAESTGLSGKRPGDVMRGVWDATRWVFNSARGTIKIKIDKAPTDAKMFMNYLWDAVATDPGTGREVTVTLEEFVERTVAAIGSTIGDVLRVNGMDQNLLTGGLTAEHSKTVLALLYDENAAPGATQGARRVAGALRRIMNDAYLKATEAGLEMGYVENKGYLPRIINRVKANLNPGEFRERASKVYKIHFDNEVKGMDVRELLSLAGIISNRKDPSRTASATKGVYASEAKALIAAVKKFNTALSANDTAKAAAEADPNDAAKAKAAAKAKTALADAKKEVATARAALEDAVRPDYADTSAENWLRRIQTGTGTSFDSMTPTADFKAKRALPPEAEEIMGDMYADDPLTLVMDYVHDTTKRAEYQNRYGVENKANDKLDAILSREAVQDAISANPSKYNTKTAKGRLAILRDLTDRKQDNLKEMAIEEARKNGADPDDLVTLRGHIAAVLATADYLNVSRTTQVVTSAIYVLGTLALLPRAAITSISEPLTFFAKTGDFKNTVRLMGIYMKEAVRGAKSVQELAAISRMVGLVSSPLHDIVMMNRVMDGGPSGGAGAVLLQRFFRANGLTQLTNAQRRATFKASFFMMQSLAKRVTDPADTPAKKGWQQVARGDFRDAGVPDAKIDAFAEWLLKQTDFPDIDAFQTPEGQMFAAAGMRLVDQTIQNPRRADKTLAAMHPVGRLAFGLTSFIYAFTRNIIAARINRTKRISAEMQAAGVGTAKARAIAATEGSFVMATGFLAIFTGQFLVGMARAYIMDNDQWQKHGEDGDDDRYAWLAALAFSRSGIFGVADVPMQAITGLRYERDLTSLTAGPAISLLLSGMQNVLNGLPHMKAGPYEIASRNSANNDNAEHTAMKALYRMFAIPAVSALAALTPVSSKAGWALRYGAATTGTSGTAADAFADLFFEKTSRGTR